MRKRLLTIGCAALAALFAIPTASAQQSNGPIREGVRGVAEGTAQAVRRTGEVTRNVIRGTAEGTANAVRRTGEAARNLGENTRDRLRGDGDYQRNNQSYNNSQNLNNQIDGQYQGEYQSGYRGAEGQGQNDAQNQPMQAGEGQSNSNQGTTHSGQVYQLRHDASGREFICMNGQRVYFENDNQSSANAQPTTQRAMYGSEESFQGQNADRSSESNQDRPELNQTGQDNHDSVPPVPQPESANPNQPLNSADQAIENDANRNDRDSQAIEKNSPQDEQSTQKDVARSKGDSKDSASDKQKESDN